MLSCSNITITGVPGLDPVPMLDFQYKLAVLQLCDTCWLTLLNMAVKDDRMVSTARRSLALLHELRQAGHAAAAAAAG